MTASASEPLCFGSFRLEVEAGRLLCEGQEIQLRPKAWEVLCYLAQRPERVVSIDELLDNCWRDLHVGPHALTNVIYLLRSVFTAGKGDPNWIQTVARRGYRFSAPLTTPPRAAPPQDDNAAKPLDEQDELFVGRHSELGLLQQCWQQVLGRQPQVIFVAGEPGIGKTTVIRQFCKTAEPQPLLCIGRCFPQTGEAEPYMPVLEALGSLPSLDAVVEVAREQAPTWLIQMPWLLSKDERVALRDSLAGVGPARMLREGRRLFTELAEQTPVLLVLEDLHWADSATVDLVRALAESERPSRLMVVATYRSSEAVVRRHPLLSVVSELSSRSRHVHLLPLGSLTLTLVREYLSRRFANAALAAEIAPLLEEKSGGNPLFLAAMSSYLCAQQRIVCGADGWRLISPSEDLEVGLPDGLRDMIRAQLQRLDPEELGVLEAASAAGVHFTTLELAAALEISAQEAEDACAKIARAGHFIGTAEEVTWPDGSVAASYRFTHAAYHQALGAGIPPGRRRLLHARIGMRLEAVFGKRAREIAPRLAAHFEAAGDLEREVEYLKRSVQLAAGRYAHRETLAYIDRTIDVLGRLPITDERNTALLGWQVERSTLVMDWQGYASGFDSFARVVELSRQQGSALLEFIGHAGCGLSALMGHGHRDEAPAEFEAMLAIAADGHPELTALAHIAAGSGSDSFGNPAEGLRHAEVARAALQHSLLGIPRGYDLEALVHMLSMTCMTRLGELERARRERELLIQCAEAGAGLGGQAHGFAFAACDSLISAEPAVAVDLAERAIDRAREGGFMHFAYVGEAAREAGRSMIAADAEIDPEGLERLAAAIAERRRLGESWYNMLFAGYLVDGYRRRGDLDRARSEIDAAFAEAEVVYVPELWRIKGEIEVGAARTQKAAARQRGIEAAADCFRSSIALARQHKTRLFELRSAVALARLRQGTDGSRGALETIYRSFPTNLEYTDLRTAAELLRQL